MINDGVVVNLPGLEFDRGEFRPVGRVGVMLRFHAKGGAMLVNPPVFARDRAVQKIARVKLQARFGRENFQDAAAFRFGHPRHQLQLADFLVDDPVVIVAASELELFVVLPDARPNGRRSAEIKRRIVYRPQFPRRNQRRVNRREAVGQNRDLVVENVAFAGQVEIGMLREIDDRVLVGLGPVLQAKPLSRISV